MLTLKEMDSKIKLQKATNAEAQNQFHAWYAALSHTDKTQFDKYSKRKKIFTRFFLAFIVLLLIGGAMEIYDRNAHRNSTAPAAPAPTVAIEAQTKQAEAEKKAQAEQAAKAKEKATSAINQAVGDTIAEFKNPQNYPLVKDVSIKVDQNKKEVTMALVVNPATNKKAALDMADTLIRRYSSNVVIHDSSFTMPTKDSYGNLFDTYNISIGVAPAQYVGDRSKWLYDQYITAGMHTKQGPNWKNAR